MFDLSFGLEQPKQKQRVFPPSKFAEDKYLSRQRDLTVRQRFGAETRPLDDAIGWEKHCRRFNQRAFAA